VGVIAKIFFLGFLFSTAGCALVPGLRLDPQPAPQTGNLPAYDVQELTPAVLAEPVKPKQFDDLPVELTSPSSQASREYLIGSGDVLSITVWDHPELTSPAGEFRDAVSGGRLVANDGTMFYPFVGIFKAEGKTVQQVRDFLSDKLKQFIQKPQVDVAIASFRSQRVQVTGQVGTPGTVMLNDTVKGVLEAITERGGLSANASRREAILVRDRVQYRIDLAGLLSGSRPVPNVALQPGDLIHVPDASDDRVFMLGEVSSQKPVVMQQSGLTLIEALTEAGGLDKMSADDSGVLVFRRAEENGGKPIIYTLKLGRPQGMLLASEFRLAPRDVVYVTATAFSQYNLIIREILPTVTTIFQLRRLNFVPGL